MKKTVPKCVVHADLKFYCFELEKNLKMIFIFNFLLLPELEVSFSYFCSTVLGICLLKLHDAMHPLWNSE